MAKQTAKPVEKPVAKQTAKPVEKPVAKQTAKPEAKPEAKPAAKAKAKKPEKIADFEIGKVNTNRDVEGAIKRLREALLDLEADRIEKTSEIVGAHLDLYNDRASFTANVAVLHAAASQFNLINKFYYAD